MERIDVNILPVASSLLYIRLDDIVNYRRLILRLLSKNKLMEGKNVSVLNHVYKTNKVYLGASMYKQISRNLIKKIK